MPNPEREGIPGCLMRPRLLERHATSCSPRASASQAGMLRPPGSGSACARRVCALRAWGCPRDHRGRIRSGSVCQSRTLLVLAGHGTSLDPRQTAQTAPT
eukprot:2332931-Rhodomonas_salina.8